MSTYSKTKFLSKSLILLSLLAVVISGGAFLVKKNQIGADTPTEQSKNYKIVMEGNTVKYILASNMQSEEVLSVTASKTAPDIQFFGDYCEMVSNDPNSGTGCYILLNKNPWEDPSIMLEGGKYKPAWAFLTEVKARTEQFGDTDSLNKIKSVSAGYVAGAFNRYLKPNFDFTATSGVIVIPNEEFFQELNNAGMEASDPYMEFFQDGGVQKAKMKFAPNYPEAKENSVWLAASEFVVESMIKHYKDAGLDSSNYEAGINLAKRNYILGIKSEDKGKVLTLTYPPKLLLSQNNEKLFKYEINTDDFQIPTNGYKTRISIKPVSKKDDAAYISFGPYSGAVKEFSWSEATAGGYVDGNGQSTTVSGADYDLTFPQQYIIRAITYENDGTTEKDNLLATFETHTEETIGNGGTISSGDLSSILKISATPKYVKQGEAVTATIEAIDSTDPAKQIKKVVLWACTGDKDFVLASDSSSCLLENGQEAVKASFSAGSNLTFDSNNNATMSATWETSGSSIGDHALMAKAHTAETGGYIEYSKTAVTIKVTNSSIGAATTGAGRFSGLMSWQYNKRASENPTGSKIKTIQELANRIATWVIEFIGILAFFALVYGGFTYMSAGGDSTKADKAKKVIMYAILGLVLAVLAYAITRILVHDILSIFPGLEKHIFP